MPPQSDSARSQGQPSGPNTGIQGVLALPEFRKLWLGQVFSQLADKFYIVLMVFLIAQYWVSATPPAGGALAEAAGALNLSIESRAQLITLLATGVYVANTIPAMVLGLVFIFVGLILTLTIVGAIVGVPLAIVGALLFFKGLA